VQKLDPLVFIRVDASAELTLNLWIATDGETTCIQAACIKSTLYIRRGGCYWLGFNEITRIKSRCLVSSDGIRQTALMYSNVLRAFFTPGTDELWTSETDRAARGGNHDTELSWVELV